MYISQINNNTFGNTKGMFLRKAFGYALVDECERIQRELDRGKKIDDILNGK